MKKLVNYPIQVPEGDYCWNGGEICQFFDNEGGHPTCELGFWEQKRASHGGVLKAEECIELKEVT